MTDGAPSVPEPTILMDVPAPDGADCQIWRKDERGKMAPCDQAADVLFVYQQSLSPGDDRRANALACADCAPLSDLPGGDAA